MRGTRLKLKIFLNVLFIFERDRDRVWTGRGRERETQNPERAPGSELSTRTEPDAGLELTSHEIVTWAEVGCSTDGAARAPQDLHFLKVYLLSNLYTRRGASTHNLEIKVMCSTDSASQVPLLFLLSLKDSKYLIIGVHRGKSKKYSRIPHFGRQEVIHEYTTTIYS